MKHDEYKKYPQDIKIKILYIRRSDSSEEECKSIIESFLFEYSTATDTIEFPPLDPNSAWAEFSSVQTNPSVSSNEGADL